MSIWQSILNVLFFQEPKPEIPFELSETDEDKFPVAQSSGQNQQNQQNQQPQQPQQPAPAPSASVAKGNSAASNQKQPSKTDQPNQTAGTETDQDQTNPETEQPHSQSFRQPRRPVRPAKIEDPVSVNIVQTVMPGRKNSRSKSAVRKGDEESNDANPGFPGDSRTAANIGSARTNSRRREWVDLNRGDAGGQAATKPKTRLSQTSRLPVIRKLPPTSRSRVRQNSEGAETDDKAGTGRTRRAGLSFG